MTNEAGRARLRGLYAVTPEMPDTSRLAAIVEAAMAGGAALVQYRAKNVASELALEQARALVCVCRRGGVPLIINDALDLALAVGADGVHLGRDDLDAKTARARFPRGLIGVSCYADPAKARAAAEAGADYVAIGSVFPSRTKPSAVPAPLALLRAAGQMSSLPVVAIGGIEPGNARSLIDAGADMVAVISALFDAPDVTQAARAFARLFDRGLSGADDVRTQQRAV
jgi:thiamine-phosphate pyrophosphorylase